MGLFCVNGIPNSVGRKCGGCQAATFPFLPLLLYTPQPTNQPTNRGCLNISIGYLIYFYWSGMLPLPRPVHIHLPNSYILLTFTTFLCFYLYSHSTTDPQIIRQVMQQQEWKRVNTLHTNQHVQAEAKKRAATIWDHRAAKIVDAMRHSWYGYQK